jgi:hypothetical protein
MSLRVIPTNIHGILDYLASGVNLAFPGILGLHDAPWAALVPRIDGVAGAAYSLITDYEFGALRVLPMPPRTWRSMPRRAPSWRRRLGSSGSPRTAPATGCRTC